jgi:hypothetical protein
VYTSFHLVLNCISIPPSYLRASKWVLEKATQRLEATLKWRREYGVYTIVTAEHVEPEVSQFERKGRICITFYLHPSLTNLGSHWEAGCLRLRCHRETRVIHVPEPPKHRRGHSADTVCGLDDGVLYRSHGPRRRVSTNATLSSIYLQHFIFFTGRSAL